MLAILKNRTYHHLFFAQVIALVGTSLATVALGLPATAIILAGLAVVAIGIAFAIWPADDPEVVEHSHADLPSDRLHLIQGGLERRHAHAYVIDDMHAAWPRER